MTKHRKFPPAPERCYDDGDDSPRRVWALLARPERDDKYPSSLSGGYRHLRFDIVSVVDTYDDAKKQIRNPGTDAMSDLEISSQGNQYTPDELYGYGLEYRRPYGVNLYKLSSMHWFLSTFERRMAALKQEHGRVPDFAHWLVRVGRVLDIHYLIEKRSSDPDGWSSYDRGDYRFHSCRTDNKFNGEELLYTVERLVRDLWTESDRKAAAAHDERVATEKAAREAAETAEVVNG